ncbi:cyclic nucleotide-binding-like protein [Blyttiomyces helicus]|uniref:Cyclic nucleotide-binding-like protein n=1 Tax=Blyttiomyces helicus TaxID=388810 RepID=A0A4P9WTJ7_9FUNG|nr:cyclic nucleotide-binding-like protein [Blyttiomyces helicus]|eukprot:RKO94680.1 cyclic nucleotide-binding-like protein [Blyttiomyces helicus]
MRARIIEYYEFKYSGGKYFDEKAILKELSGPLRQAVSVHNCKHLILQVTFFREADNKFITELSLVLEERHFLEGDLIMHEGDDAEEMYFIWTGTCAVSVQGTKIALMFSGMKRTATIHAASPCVLYSLSKQNLDAVLDRFQEVADTVHQVKRLVFLGAVKGAPRIFHVAPNARSPPQQQVAQERLANFAGGGSCSASTASGAGPRSQYKGVQNGLARR